jgi:hypothetical protein
VPESAKGEAGSEPQLAITAHSTLSALVADIAARGTNRGPRLLKE